MAPAPTRAKLTKPQSGLAPTRKAPEPPVVPRSPREWPAKDWPRTTVKTPTTAETTDDGAADQKGHAYGLA